MESSSSSSSESFAPSRSMRDTAITLLSGVFRSWRDMRSTSSRSRTLSRSACSCARRSVMSVREAPLLGGDRLLHRAPFGHVDAGGEHPDRPAARVEQGPARDEVVALEAQRLLRLGDVVGTALEDLAVETLDLLGVGELLRIG